MIDTLTEMKRVCSYQNYQVLSGFSLDYPDFQNGNCIENDVPKENSIMISWDGYDTLGRNENGTYGALTETAHIFFKTSIDSGMTIRLREFMDGINDENSIKLSDYTKSISILGATTYKMDKIEAVFIIDLEIL